MVSTPDGAVARVPDRGRHRALYGISGLINLVVGVLVLAYPQPTVKVLGVLLGLELLLVAVLLVVHGASGSSRPTEGPTEILLGAVALIGGLVVIRNPTKSLTLLAVAFAVYLVVAGALTLGRGLVGAEQRWTTLIRGALLTSAGIIIISWPHIGAKALAIVAGIALVSQGVLEIAEAIFAREPSSAGGEA